MTAPYPPPGVPQGWEAVYGRAFYDGLADRFPAQSTLWLYYHRCALADWCCGEWTAGDGAPLLDLRADGGGT
jgi:hypothetical protein